mmetsp:Transcript_25559/g.4271  ORF Transcript_25559/g.4271 Transcript_25559/m.4271 type:complete len:91 (-) Transcript_25559:186-458(-)
MKKFLENGKYSIIDNQNLVLYFTHKNSNIFEARLLVKVVPNSTKPPFLSAIIKPINPENDTILMNSDYVITGFTSNCSELFEIQSTKSQE